MASPVTSAAPTAVAALPPVDGSDWHPVLASMYAAFNMPKLSRFAEIVQKYAGLEHELYAALASKYAPQGIEWHRCTTLPEAGHADWALVLGAVYAECNPVKLKVLPTLLAKYHGREQQELYRPWAFKFPRGFPSFRMLPPARPNNLPLSQTDRTRKRKAAVDSVKKSPAYKKYHASDPLADRRARTPDPEDSTISKNQWEQAMFAWRSFLRD